MPKIIIREKDYTSPGFTDYENFAVVVPGFANADKVSGAKGTLPGQENSVFDENGIYEVSDLDDFVKNVGLVPAVEIAFSDASDNIPAHYGNQIAYELLNMGYTVLYVYMGSATVSDSQITADTTLLSYYKKLIATSGETLFEPLKDKANYDFRFILTGFLTKNVEANKNAITVAGFREDLLEGRGDAMALCDIDEAAYLNAADKTPSGIIKAIAVEANKYYNINTNSDFGKYVNLIAPSLCYSNSVSGGLSEYNKNTKFPGSFHYLACFARARANSFKEWYAIAGLTRGLSNYTVESTSVKLGEPAINALEPRQQKTIGDTTLKVAVNLIVKIRGTYYLWGNRTAYELGDKDSDLIASHFLNIRQLCCTLKKEIYVACRRFTFDPNSDVLWVNFCNALRPTLEEMKADQGIRDYQIIRVVSTKKAELKARIRIVPIEAVEDFDIELSLEDSLGNTTVSISE